MVASELMSVELADEVLCGRTAEGTTGIDITDEHPLLLIGAAHLKLHQVGTFPHTLVTAVAFAKGALKSPVLQVGRRIDPHLLPHRQNHVPLLYLGIPESLGVAEVLLAADQHRVACIFLKGLSIVIGDGHRLRLTLSSRGIESHHLIVLLVDHARATEDRAQRIGLDSNGLRLPVYKVFRGGVSPVHILPLRTVGVPLIEQMVDAILIEHAVRVVHPTIERGMMIDGTILLTIGCIKGIALFHLTPAEEVFHGTGKATVTMERDIEQQFLFTKAADIQRHIIVDLVHRQLHIESLHLPVIGNHLDTCVFLTLLNRQQQILAAHLHLFHRMILAQYSLSISR